MKRYAITKFGKHQDQLIETENGALVKHDEAHAIIKEFAEAMISTSIRYSNDGKSCKHCKELVWGRSSMEKVKHKPDCIVNKAEQWLKEDG